MFLEYIYVDHCANCLDIIPNLSGSELKKSQIFSYLIDSVCLYSLDFACTYNLVHWISGP